MACHPNRDSEGRGPMPYARWPCACKTAACAQSARLTRLRLQFHDICFGGAPAMGHQEPELLDAVFPSFELRFADVRLLPVSVPVSFQW